MGEVQKTGLGGEVSQRFIEFVLAQRAVALDALALMGAPEAPTAGDAAVAKRVIDQLGAAESKVRGLISPEATSIFAKVLADLEGKYRERLSS